MTTYNDTAEAVETPSNGHVEQLGSGAVAGTRPQGTKNRAQGCKGPDRASTPV